MGKSTRKLKPDPPPPVRTRLADTIVGIALVIVCVVVFWQVRNFEFLNYDDTVYVVNNHHVRTGLTWESVKWAFTEEYASNWHPLTWISHMIDVELFGIERTAESFGPGGHHLTNVILHVANTVLLYLVLRVMTRRVGAAAMVAALFAVHPMHVQSVAWVAERKDVLSGFFWFLTLLAYALYVRKRSTLRYLFVFGSLAVGLMAKPMLVTLPFVLLLLDMWPLNRMTTDRWSRENTRLVLEKLPLMGLSLASCVITFVVQNQGGAVQSLEAVPMGLRLQNVPIAYVQYLIKFAVPHPLTVLYPLNGAEISAVKAVASGVLLAILTTAAVWLLRRHAWVACGWFFFLGTLVPVIGIVQVGEAAYADRYTYIPFVGLFLLMAHGLYRFAGESTRRRVVAGAAAVLWIVILAVMARAQTHLWQNSETLFRHTLAHTRNNPTAHMNLGTSLMYRARIKRDPQMLKEAVDQLEQAGRLRENDRQKVQLNLGIVNGIIGRDKIAEAIFVRLLERDPANAKAHGNLGLVYRMQNKHEKALFHFREAVRLDPGNYNARRNLKDALRRKR